MADQVRRAELKSLEEFGRILGMCDGLVSHTLGDRFVGPGVPPAVGDGSVTLGYRRHLLVPDGQVIEPAMDEHDRLTGALLDVGQLGAVDPRPLERTTAQALGQAGPGGGFRIDRRPR
jgi:hypothetical protein